MKLIQSLAISFILLLSLFVWNGCKKEDSNPIVTGGQTNQALFTSPGSMAFKSTKSDFSVNGIFDTTMTAGQGAGAFIYQEGNKNFLIIMGYSKITDTTLSLAFMGITDTMNALTTTSYPFGLPSGSKGAIFGYIPTFNPKANTLFEMYSLYTGDVQISTLSSILVQGTISGTGVNVLDTTKTISISQGTFIVPMVNYKKIISVKPSNDLDNNSGMSVMNAVRQILRKEF